MCGLKIIEYFPVLYKGGPAYLSYSVLREVLSSKESSEASWARMSQEVRKGHCSVIFTQLAKWYQLKSIWNAFNKRPAKTNVLCVNPRV